VGTRQYSCIHQCESRSIIFTSPWKDILEMFRPSQLHISRRRFGVAQRKFGTKVEECQGSAEEGEGERIEGGGESGRCRGRGKGELLGGHEEFPGIDRHVGSNRGNRPTLRECLRSPVNEAIVGGGKERKKKKKKLHLCVTTRVAGVFKKFSALKPFFSRKSCTSRAYPIQLRHIWGIR
jgi:hypothetical protein